MRLIIAIVAAMLSFSACDNRTATAIKTQTISEEDIPYVILSQDTFDNDNFSLISAARELDNLGKIHLLAIDVTGRDIDNKAGLLFSLLMVGTEIPILINHESIVTRVVPSSRIYKRLDQFPSDELLDTEREDSSICISSILRSLPQGKKAIYVVGGHLTNLASLMRYDLDVVKQRINTIVISSGWKSRTDGEPEMNMSGGMHRPSGISADTRYVFSYLPKTVKVVIASDPDAPYRHISMDTMKHNDPLYYLVRNGHYSNKKDVGTGDFEALLYASSGIDWHGHKLGSVVKTCFNVNDIGAITISKHAGECEHYYLDDVDTNIAKDILIELLR